MSEVNLNEQVNVTVADAAVITVPIDATLTNSNEAADAKAVGDALALKADRSELQAAVKVNGQAADAQGEIIVDGTEILMGDSDNRTIQEAVAAVESLTGEDIPVDDTQGAQSIAEAVSDAANKSAADIPMSAGGTQTINQKIGAMDTAINANANAITGLQQRTGETILLEADGDESITEAVEKRVKTVNGYGPDSSGNVNVMHALTADNLTSDESQTVTGTFTKRTSGGGASIKDGPAVLSIVRGNSSHTGKQEEFKQVLTSWLPRETGEALPVVTVNWTTYIAYAPQGPMEFDYLNGSWTIPPSGYGITVSGGELKNGDGFSVTYIAADRGVITVSDPQTFVSTGWNLYNHDLGYAMALQYEEYAKFKFEGTGTLLEFSTTTTGARTTILPDGNGVFTITGNGYIFVTGGNATDTAIYMCWGDWQETGPAEWEAYTESVIDLGDIMEECFPNGLMRVGEIRDEINFNTGIATSKISRTAWSQAAQDAAEASGRAWDADRNYVYLERENYIETEIDLDSRYTASDHGLEYYTGTPLGVYTVAVYGNNLKNKLERDVLTISAQTLTAEQQEQARTNIGAAGAAALEDLATQMGTIGTVVTGTNASSMTVGSSTTVVSTITSLPAGTWLLIGHAQWSSGFDQNYVMSLYAGSQMGESIIRNTGASGGGSVTMAVVSPTSATTYTLRLSQSSGSNKTASNVKLVAVRLAA